LGVMTLIADVGAPWWGIPVVAGGFALAGIILGQAVGLVQERSRARISRQRQWDTVVFESVTKFLVDVEAQWHQEFTKAKGDRTWKSDLDDFDDQLITTIVLLSPWKIASVCIDLYSKLTELLEEDDDGADRELAIERHDAAFSDLYQVVREHLGTDR
jgi:hypothetical protein